MINTYLVKVRDITSRTNMFVIVKASNELAAQCRALDAIPAAYDFDNVHEYETDAQLLEFCNDAIVLTEFTSFEG